MVDISGRCDDGYGAVKDAFAKNFELNGDVGASCAVVRDGELVVDLWGGSLDVEGTTPWEQDTIINVFSSTKTMSCLALLTLVSRGLVDVDEPVHRYWQEFEQAGKANVLVRHILSHTAGLPGWDERLDVSDLYDWDKATGMLAQQASWWEPGTKSGYHGISQGNLVGEVVRRVDGRSVGRFFAEEIAGPLGADFHIGLGAEHDHRVALVIPAPPLAYAGEGSAGDEGGDGPDRDSIPYRAALWHPDWLPVAASGQPERLCRYSVARGRSRMAGVRSPPCFPNWMWPVSINGRRSGRRPSCGPRCVSKSTRSATR